MEWKNPDGSVTRGVIIEDGAGNKVTSLGGGGAGGSNASVGADGSAAPANATEIGFVNAVGNLAAVSPSNPLPVVSNFPATQAVIWSGQAVSLSGSLPAFAATPNFNLGSSIPAGSNVIGAVNLYIGGATVGQANPVPTSETYSSIATGQISVAATATQIVPARAGRKEVTIVNHATTAVYIGGSSVTATTGLFLSGVQGQGITITGGAAIYATTASGSETVSFLEVY